jgi:phosphatidylglycerol:prolipoprotein diacylglycerol transferase
VLYTTGVLGILLGLWGSYLLGFVYYGTDGRPWAWFRFWSGGRAEYGGLIAGTLAVLVVLNVRKLSFVRYADAMAPATALGVSIARIGCFLNGDDYGTVSHLPWSVQFPAGTEAYADHLPRGWISPNASWSLPVHPVQLYDSLYWLGLFVVLARLSPKRPGLRFRLFLIVHGAGRFAEQFLRGDFQRLVGRFSLTQLISVLFVATGAAVLWAEPIGGWGRSGAKGILLRGSEAELRGKNDEPTPGSDTAPSAVPDLTVQSIPVLNQGRPESVFSLVSHPATR